MSWKGYKSPEAPNAPDTGSSPSPTPCLLLLILAKSTPTPIGQGGPRACQLSGLLLLWAFSGRSLPNRLKKMSLQGHTCRRVHTHGTPAVSYQQEWCPSPTQVFLPFGEGAQGTRREGISALGGHPPGLQNPAGASPGTKEELPRPEAQRPASAPGTSAGAQHTQASPRTQESPTRPCSHPRLLSGCGWTGTHCHTVASTPAHLLRYRAGTQPTPRCTPRAWEKPRVQASSILCS